MRRTRTRLKYRLFNSQLFVQLCEEGKYVIHDTILICDILLKMMSSPQALDNHVDDFDFDRGLTRNQNAT